MTEASIRPGAGRRGKSTIERTNRVRKRDEGRRGTEEETYSRTEHVYTSDVSEPNICGPHRAKRGANINHGALYARACAAAAERTFATRERDGGRSHRHTAGSEDRSDLLLVLVPSTFPAVGRSSTFRISPSSSFSLFTATFIIITTENIATITPASSIALFARGE